MNTRVCSVSTWVSSGAAGRSRFVKYSGSPLTQGWGDMFHVLQRMPETSDIYYIYYVYSVFSYTYIPTMKFHL